MFVARAQLEPFYKDPKKLDADLKLSSDSSVEDDKLFEWLSKDENVWPALCPVFQRRVNTRKSFESWLLKADQVGFHLDAEMRRIGAFFILLELREFAGHSLWNRAGKVLHYEDIVKNVHDRVSKRFDAPLRKEMSVTDRELSLSAMVLKDSLEHLSADKVADLLKESEFESVSDFDQLRKGLVDKLSGAGRAGIKSIIGKTLTKALPFTLRRAGLFLSLGFLMRDAYQLGGEATRVTNPAVIIISIYRSFSGD